MRDSKWAVNATTILQRWVHCSVVFLVALVTHVVGAKAFVLGVGAAEHALPVNLVVTVLLASLFTGTELF